MDLDLTPTPTKSAEDSEIDTPPRTQAQPIKALSFINGTHKNHNHHSPPQPTYKECMKNHAAALGGHAVDGCGEFMPSPAATPTDPTSLTCAACGCHRNFHRREFDFSAVTATITPPFLDFRPPLLLPAHRSSPSPTSPHTHTIQFGPHTLLTLNTAAEAGEQDHHQAPVTPAAENPTGRKRFRTKFTQLQKEKMCSFSDKLGWRIQKCDEVEVEKFCKEVGVTKGVLKVWMHNNKNTLGKKDTVNGCGTINIDGRITSFNSRKMERRKSDDEIRNFQIIESGGGVLSHRSNNGSSSSSP